MIRPNEPVRPERELDAAAERRRHRRLVLLIVWLAVLASMIYSAIGPGYDDAAWMEQTYRSCVADMADIDLGSDFQICVEEDEPFAVAGATTARVPDDVHETCFGLLFRPAS